MNNEWTISQTRVIRRPSHLSPSGDDERRTPFILCISALENISAFELNVDQASSEYQAYGIRKRKIPVESASIASKSLPAAWLTRLPCGAIQITKFSGMVRAVSLN
jgi:hypothetical protein